MFGATTAGDTSGYGRLVRPSRCPARDPRPYGGWFDEAADSSSWRCPTRTAYDDVSRRSSSTAASSPSTSAASTSSRRPTLRDDPALRFEMCLGVTGVHFPRADGPRAARVSTSFLSMTHNRRVRVEVSVPDADPHIPSIVSVYPTNDWHERETYDMFGIVFDGHPALTRILMPDDWPGHPQRKDYPLGGIPVEYKGAEIPPPDQRRAYH